MQLVVVVLDVTVSDPHTDAIYFTKGDALDVIGRSGPTAPTKGAALAELATHRL